MTAAEVDVSILATGHDVADARLHRLAAVLISECLSVEVRGLGTSSAGPPGAIVRTSDRRSLFRRAVRAALLPWVARGWVLIVEWGERHEAAIGPDHLVLSILLGPRRAALSASGVRSSALRDQVAASFQASAPSHDPVTPC